MQAVFFVLGFVVRVGGVAERVDGVAVRVDGVVGIGSFVGLVFYFG